ncbi:MAG: Crp/Fnr family transcriptional regulator [Burkholderiales bacterium]|nr:Crp/Fnr family transcriptional regulator [Burkholderiales bacterium]
MTSTAPFQRLLALYPSLASAPPDLLDRALADAVVHRVPAGAVMFDEHRPCEAFPMLLEGSIRVSKVSATGRELQLYRVLPGESCVITSSCLLGHQPYNARGVAETDATLVVLPAPAFARLVATHEPFRAYVFALFAERLADLMQLVEAVAFQRLDQRLAALLLGKGRVLATTHQALADELGSVREIVSRLLKSFAEQGLVALGRERIEILDPAGLRRVAGWA